MASHEPSKISSSGHSGLAGLTGITFIQVERLQPNPWNRKHFKEHSLRQLMASISEGGIKEPLTVRALPGAKADDVVQYEIASGNRRWLAAKGLGHTEVPCLVLNLSDADVQDMNLVTNIQREDLSPLEKARMLRHRMELGKFTPEQVAAKVGKSRPWALELLGFLELPPDVLALLGDLPLSIRALRALTALEDPEEQRRIAESLKDGTLHHNQVERHVQELTPKTKPAGSKDPLASVWREMKWQKSKGAINVHYEGSGHWALEVSVDPTHETQNLVTLLKQILTALERSQGDSHAGDKTFNILG